MEAKKEPMAAPQASPAAAEERSNGEAKPRVMRPILSLPAPASTAKSIFRLWP
jgi:hypothetical protein